MSAALVVAIDGPAGAGKSSVARQVAEVAGLSLVDTGAIYRALALVAEREGISWDDPAALATRAARLEIGFSLRGGRNHTLLQGPEGFEDVSEAIRSPRLSLGASAVGRHPAVRDALLELQRRLGAQGAVLEGRDIGTVVFPDAAVKVFLTASAEERARRRAEELAERGEAEPFAKVLEEIVLRDRQDSERPVAPLKPAPDAWVLDCTSLTLPEVVAQIHERIVQRAHALPG